MIRGFELKPVRVIAAKELRDRIRNRWVAAVAGVFAVFALLIAYFGPAQQGSVGFHSIELTIASLVSLVIYLVPLIVLILGYDTIVGERERGTLDLLLSMPVTRVELLLGKFVGLSGALAVSTVAGFGLAGALLAWQLDLGSTLRYAVFVGSALLMGMAFLSMALAVSVVARDRAQAGGLAVAVWFFFVLVFDLLLVGGLVLTGGGGAAAAFPYLLLVNPADVFRILNVFNLEEVRSIYGLATVMPAALGNPWLLGSFMLASIIATLSFAAWRFK
jgi:Cu-processing system permease protein